MEIPLCNRQSSPLGECYRELQALINSDSRFADVPGEPPQVEFEGSTFSFCYHHQPSGAQNNGLWIKKQGTNNWLFALCNEHHRKKARISSKANLELEAFPQEFQHNYNLPPNFDGQGIYIERNRVNDISVNEWLEEIVQRMRVL